MSPEANDDPGAEDVLSADRRRRRRAEVFGDVLPDSTSDERGDDGEREPAEGSDEWFRRQVPPHHG